MNDEADVLAKFFAISEKAIKEGGAHDPLCSGVVNENWRRKQWVHPYAVFRAFAAGMVDTEPWDCKSDSWAAMLSMVKEKIATQYLEVYKTTLCEVRRDFKIWFLADDLQEAARSLEVDVDLLIENTLLALKEHLELTASKIREFQSQDVDEEDSAAKQAS